MDPDTIAFLRDVCRKIKEVAEISDRYLALQASKNEKAESLPSKELKTPQNRLIPLSHWNKYHDWPSQGALRHMAFMRERNGFDKAVKKVGRRLLIDEEMFFNWARSNPKTLPPEPTSLSKKRHGF